jgi:hypothetical protein
MCFSTSSFYVWPLYGTKEVLHSRFAAIILDLLGVRQVSGVMISGIIKYGAHKISSPTPFSSSFFHSPLLHFYSLFLRGALGRAVG